MSQEIHAMRCSIPFCIKEPDTIGSIVVRVSTLVFGLLAIMAGILILTNIPPSLLNQFGTTTVGMATSGGAIALGVLSLVLAALVKQIKTVTAPPVANTAQPTPVTLPKEQPLTLAASNANIVFARGETKYEVKAENDAMAAALVTWFEEAGMQDAIATLFNEPNVRRLLAQLVAKSWELVVRGRVLQTFKPSESVEHREYESMLQLIQGNREIVLILQSNFCIVFQHFKEAFNSPEDLLRVLQEKYTNFVGGYLFFDYTTREYTYGVCGQGIKVNSRQVPPAPDCLVPAIEKSKQNAFMDRFQCIDLTLIASEESQAPVKGRLDQHTELTLPASGYVEGFANIRYTAYPKTVAAYQDALRKK